MNLNYYMVAAMVVVAVLASWILVAVLIRYAPQIHLLDQPNERSLHTRVTPRGGGLGVVLVLALSLAVLLALGGPLVNGAGGGLRPALMIYLGAALFIAGVSLRDDFKSLSPALRFLCQLAVAGAATAGAAFFRTVVMPGFGSIDCGGWGIGLTVIWIVGLTNVYNFMDGIDGIAGVQGVIAGLSWAVAGMWLDSPVVALLGLFLAGGCLGFLFHNWSPAKIFMGDVGSAFLGYSFATLPLLLLRERVTAERPAFGAIPIFAILVVWPFVADGFYTFVRRAWRREAVWLPHRSHLYQRLVRTGWTHAQVSSLYAVWCAGCALTGLFWLSGAAGAPWAAVLIPVCSLSGIFFLVKRQEQRAGHKHA